MKKFLSLLLALLLCVSFVVSCEKEEALSTSEPSSSSDIASSSSESSSSEEADHSTGLIMTESSADYYYHTEKYEITNGGPIQVKIAESEEDLISKLQELGFDAKSSPRYIDDAVLKTHYAFIIINHRNYYGLMGYRDIAATENGYTLIADTYKIFDEKTFYNGKVEYGDWVEFTASAAPNTSGGSCRVVVIPKSEFDTPPTAENIQIHNVIHNFTK